jgi:hypothetical protein
MPLPPNRRPPTDLVPYWATTDGQTAVVWNGDVVETLAKMPAGSVQCVTTSPPYWALRSYSPDMVYLRSDIPQEELDEVIRELESLGVYPIVR